MYKLLIYTLLILFVGVITLILLKYIQLRLMKHMKKQTYKQKKLNKQLNNNIVTANPLYIEAKELFKIGMQSRSLKREDILNLIDLIQRAIGRQHLKVYQSFKFKNDAHKIYVLLKSKEISIVDMQKIVKFLKQKLA